MMAKYWAPGKVKTRLAATLGSEVAAQLHRRFVIHLCQTLAKIADRRELVVTPRTRLKEMLAAVAHGWQGVPQSQGDLGARMQAWFQGVWSMADNALDSATSGPLAPLDDARAVLIGADCPRLKGAEIQQAFDHLLENDVVLGPATDGGYYLIGLRLNLPARRAQEPAMMELFQNIPWGTDQVRGLTQQRIEQGGFSLALLQEKPDVDHLDDLHHLREQLRFSRPPLGDVPNPEDTALATELDRILNTWDPSLHPNPKPSSS